VKLTISLGQMADRAIEELGFGIPGYVAFCLTNI
jgi:hypothetical protein